MGTASQKFYPNAIRSIDSATFTGSYQALGTALPQACRIIKITNNSSVLVTVSWDGSTDHEVIPANGFILLDVSANKEVTGICEIAANTQFYVKGSASTGLVYLSSYYAR